MENLHLICRMRRHYLDIPNWLTLRRGIIALMHYQQVDDVIDASNLGLHPDTDNILKFRK